MSLDLVIRYAMQNEARRLLALAAQLWGGPRNEDIPPPSEQLAASMVAAAGVAALRLQREAPGLAADMDLELLARCTEKVPGELPENLRPLWAAHYVDGQPLSVYSAALGLTAEAAVDELRDLVRALGNIMPKLAARTARRTAVVRASCAGA